MYRKRTLPGVRHILLGILVALALSLLLPAYALASEVVYQDTDKKDLDNPDNTYVIRGNGPGEDQRKTDGNYFTVPKDKSSADKPITIILDNVNRSQSGKSPDSSFITIKSGNYVIIKLRGSNYIQAGEDSQLGSNDGMAAIHVSKGATVKVTSEAGDGSTEGALEARGAGGKYGGAGIGTRYNDDTGTIIIAGGTIKAYGGHCGAGIGGGRDGVATDIQITGGNIEATGGQYAAGIGGGDNVGTGEGGDLYNLSITGGTVVATGGSNGAGIGGSEGGYIRGTLSISGGTVTAQGGNQAAGIGCGEGGGLGGGSINISGGTIKATGGSDGAGIGGGDGSGHISVSVNQTAGTELSIDAQGGKNAAGIGSGDSDANTVDIMLRGGTITARGGENGAGIGAGDDIETISIKGTGTVNAYGGSTAAAIGAGHDSEVDKSITIEGDYAGDKGRGLTIVADSGGGTAAGIGSGSEDCGPISLKNANIKAWGDKSAADIGTGGNWGNGGSIDHIDIENCYIETKGTNKTGAGIGAGEGCECKKISIKSSECYGNAIGEGMGVFFFFWSNYGDMDSITIEDSTIEATWDRASTSSSMGGSAAAGIGSCTLGCVKNITIKNSDITAKGIHGGAGIGSGGWGADDYLGFEYVGGEVGNITIDNSLVEATGAEPGVQSNSGSPGPDLTRRPIVGGGAGIGGGGNTNCQTITITDSIVIAKAGKYAAGIGGGGSESVDAVTISGSTVTATGGQYGAGIGSGGSTNATTATVFHADVDSISISNSNIKATGGQYAAGIGCGCGAAMDTTTADDKPIEYNITVTDSEVTAQGGEGGAGIGGGTVGAYSRGGHSGNILLSGTSHITATGGKQGSGVGGGPASDFQNHGGCDRVVVDLTSCDATAQGPDAIGNAGGWLIATGGAGAAGIGAGGYLFHNGKLDPIPNTNDTQSVEIKGGYVLATGGANDTDGAGINTGSGAGIGGGAAGTRLKNLTVSGGWVEAHAGGSDAADIGHGGNTDGKDGSDDGSNHFYVSGGTVVVDTLSAQATKTFDGGSIRTAEPVASVHNSAGTAVYRTTLKSPGAAFGHVGLKIDQVPSYGTDGLYADGDRKLYLYLPGSEENKQTATLTSGDTSYAYYGTTSTDGAGWLKIDAESITFKDPGTVRYGDKFELKLDDAQVSQGTQWDCSGTGTASVGTPWQTTSTGMYLTLETAGVGSYNVKATAKGSTDPDLYWGSKVDYTGTVAKGIPELAFTESPAKVYDGVPASDPSIWTNSPGTVTYRYNTDDGTAPTNAGTYTVTATIAETDLYEARSIEQEFEIIPAATSTVVSAQANNESVTVTATILGLLGTDGTVTFTIEGVSEAFTADVKDVNGQQVATAAFNVVPTGDYSVHAAYTSNTGNHANSDGTFTGHKVTAFHSITGQNTYETTYGDNFSLTLSDGNTLQVDPTIEGGSDVWEFSVAHDSFAQLGFEPTISVDTDGTVTVNHAGTATILCVLRDTRATRVYEDATFLVTIKVNRAPLTATSYAYRDGKNVASETYGNLGPVGTEVPGIETGVRFTSGGSPVEWDNIKDHFTGTISALPIPLTVGAGTYYIPIMRTGTGSATIGGNTYSNIFVSRDYDISYEPGEFSVEKRPLAIQALDTSGIYGGEEPAYDWDVASNQSDYFHEGTVCGLATWDIKDSVFSPDAQPTVTRSGDQEYQSLAAGTYAKVLVPSGGTSPNYEIKPVEGSLTIIPAPLSDKGRFTLSVDDTVYDGSVHEQPVTVTDTALGKTLSPGENADFTVRYLGDTTNAGHAWVVVIGRGNYTDHQAQRYAIAKRPLSIETQSATKLYDGTQLTAPGNADGIIGDDASFQVTGTQTVVGNTRNSYELVFNAEKPGVELNYDIREKLGILWVRSNDIARFQLSQPEDVRYNGQEQRQPVTLEIRDEFGTGNKYRQPVVLEDGSFRKLEEGVDYQLSYEGSAGNVTDVGTVTVTATGIGKFAGSTKSVTYDITPAPLVVDTQEATKGYDGTPLTAPGSVAGLVNDETTALIATGSITDPGSATNGYEIPWDGTAKEANYFVTHEDLGTLTVTPAPEQVVSYACTQGKDGQWTQGSEAPLTFVYERSEDGAATFAHFTGMLVDGQALSTDAFEAESGSLVLRLKPGYLGKLAVGTHTLRPLFDDGTAEEVGFMVAQASGGGTPAKRPALPNTGDARLGILGVLLAGGSAFAAGIVLRRRRSSSR